MYLCSEDMKTLASAYTALAASNENVKFVDISGSCGQKGEYFLSDGLHLNKKGYCQWSTMDAVQKIFACDAPDQKQVRIALHIYIYMYRIRSYIYVYYILYINEYVKGIQK